MQISDEIAGIIIDHHALIEGVVSEEAVLPALCLASNVMGEEAAELDNGSCVLGCGDGQAGGARSS